MSTKNKSMWATSGGQTKRVKELPDITDNLEKEVHLLKYNKTYDFFFLEKMPGFSFPAKMYDNVEANSKFICERHKQTDKNLGVLLLGEKGSGKSLLAKHICMERNIPVIMIQEKYEGDVFKSFLYDLNEPVIIFIDEYDKIYDDSNTLLSIMDGASNTNILWLLTSNRDSISFYMKNRPSRIRYVYRFKDMSIDTVKEIVNDNLIDKSKTNDFISFCSMHKVNLDMLLTLINEANDTNRSLAEILVTFNFFFDRAEYDCTVFDKKNGVYSVKTLLNDHPYSLDRSNTIYIPRLVSLDTYMSKGPNHADTKINTATEPFIYENDYDNDDDDDDTHDGFSISDIIKNANGDFSKIESILFTDPVSFKKVPFLQRGHDYVQFTDDFLLTCVSKTTDDKLTIENETHRYEFTKKTAFYNRLAF